MSKKTLNVEYERPRFWRRIFSRLLDIIILLFLTLVIFIPTRAIVTNSETYRNLESDIRKEQLNSGLYVTDYNGEHRDIVSYIDESLYYSVGQKNEALKEVIQNSFTYFGETVSLEKQEEIEKEYKNFLLSDKLVFDGKHYFIIQNGEIVKNSECTADAGKYYENVYCQFIDNNLQGHLVKDVKTVIDAMRKEAMLLLFLEIPVSFSLAAFLTYILPTLIFRRQRYTIGRLAYRIGLVDKDLLSVKGKTLLAKNLIFFFAEALLSLFTLGIPLFISFTMILTTKKSQGFSDYMTGIQEIDLTKGKIYLSKEEILVDQINIEKKAVSFSTKNLEN